MLPLVYNDEVMFPVCAGIETKMLSALAESMMFPVCAGIETGTLKARSCLP